MVTQSCTNKLNNSHLIARGNRCFGRIYKETTPNSTNLFFSFFFLCLLFLFLQPISLVTHGHQMLKIYLFIFTKNIIYSSFQLIFYKNKNTKVTKIMVYSRRRKYDKEKTAWSTYQPLTPQHQYAYSPYCSLYIFWGADKENLFNNQGLL